MRKLFQFLLGCFLASAAQAATSLNQYGITWSWQEDRQTGQFANGDYWVVGPITLTGISPASVTASPPGFTNIIVNGSMINPIADDYPQHGFDGRVLGYNEANNMARKSGAPLSGSNTRVVAAGSSICSSISDQATAGPRAYLSDFAVLTVVASAPAAGAFRPPYIGTDKTIYWNKSSLDYSILKNTAGVTGFTAQPDSADFTRPWMEVCTEYNLARSLHPSHNQPEYEPDMGDKIMGALLGLHLNYSNAQKELAYVRIVQYGIDIYGVVKYGTYQGTYAAQPGNYSAKAPLVFAALALNDTDMKFYANAANKVSNPFFTGTVQRFVQDRQTWYLKSSNVGEITGDNYFAVGGPRPAYTATAQMVGIPSFLCDNESFTYSTSGTNWGADYNNIRTSRSIGQELAMQLTTGAKTLWGRDAIFDYADRAFGIYTTSTYTAGNTIAPYVQAMWAAYRSLGAAQWSIPAPVSGIGWIPPAGNTMTIEYTDNVTGGAAGNGGVTISATGGAVTWTYSTGNGTAQRTGNLSRTITAGEIVTYTFTQPGNGVEAYTGGVDVPTATGIWVVNYVTPETGGGGGRSGGGGGSAPAAPSSPGASVISSSQINLSWTDNSSDETGFIVERSLDNSTWTSVATTAANATSQSATGLTASTLYYLRVRATNDSGSSANVTASATTSATAPASLPVARLRRLRAFSN